MRFFLCLLLVSCGSSDGSLTQTFCEIDLNHTSNAVYVGDHSPCKALLENNTGAFRVVFSATTAKPSIGRLSSVVIGPLSYEFKTGEATFSNTTVSFSREYPNVDRDGSSIQLPIDGLTDATASFSFTGLSEENYPLVVSLKFELIQPSGI